MSAPIYLMGFFRILPLAGLSLLVSACGQSGPLYLPVKAPMPPVQPASPTSNASKKAVSQSTQPPVQESAQPTQ